MLKIKIFNNYSKEIVEKEVNEFLEREKNIGIVQMDHKLTIENESPLIHYSVVILYTHVSSLKIMQ